jgi:hypothetical protein
MKRYLFALIIFLPLMVAHADVPSVTLPRCTQAQHDAYQTTGPDGLRYPTWHPQIDPYFGCYFDHEHGSNPALYNPGVQWIAGSTWPAFGYSAAQMGMSEGHAGFKVYVFRVGGYRFMLMQHQGTANAALAACTRYHTLDIYATRESDGVQVANVHSMADFGQAEENTTHIPICGVVNSSGVRQLPVGQNAVAYEPWRTDVVTGTLDTRITFNTRDPQTACATISCTSTLNLEGRGAFRTLTIEWLKINGINLIHADCKPYGMDYWYDCSETDSDAEFYRRMPYVTGAN